MSRSVFMLRRRMLSAMKREVLLPMIGFSRRLVFSRNTLVFGSTRILCISRLVYTAGMRRGECVLVGIFWSTSTSWPIRWRTVCRA